MSTFCAKLSPRASWNGASWNGASWKFSVFFPLFVFSYQNIFFISFERFVFPFYVFLPKFQAWFVFWFAFEDLFSLAIFLPTSCSNSQMQGLTSRWIWLARSEELEMELDAMRIFAKERQQKAREGGQPFMLGGAFLRIFYFDKVQQKAWVSLLFFCILAFFDCYTYWERYPQHGPVAGPNMVWSFVSLSKFSRHRIRALFALTTRVRRMHKHRLPSFICRHGESNMETATCR